MNRALLAAAMRLADIVAGENRALQALDFAAAAALLGDKNAAIEALAAAAAADPAPTAPDRAEIEAVAALLRDRLTENKARLEHAMAVQGRLIGIVALAGRSVLARSAPRYGVRGQAAEAPAVAMALSARA